MFWVLHGQHLVELPRQPCKQSGGAVPYLQTRKPSSSENAFPLEGTTEVWVVCLLQIQWQHSRNKQSF